MLSGEWTDGAFPILDRKVYSTSGACSVSPFTTPLDGQRVAFGMHTAPSEPWALLDLALGRSPQVVASDVQHALPEGPIHSAV
jgi:hypothetical protein